MRVGFVGAGRMGQPMIRRLLAAGHQVCALGRSSAARRVLIADGARVVGDLAGVGAGADAVVVCVHTDEQVRDVCLRTDLLDGVPEGGVVVVHTTGHPATVEAIAARVGPRGVQVIDAPVSGGPHDVAAGQVTLFVGGTEDALARARPALASYGDPVLRVGSLGAGQRVKLVNNALFAAQIGLLCDAVRLGAQLGIDEATLLGALPHGSARSRALAGVAGRGSVAMFAAAVAEFLRKDLHVVRTVAAELGADLGALEAALNAVPDAVEFAG